MPVFRDETGRWRYRVVVDLLDGTTTRINGSAPRNENTKDAAKQAERDHIARMQHGEAVPEATPATLATPAKKEITFRHFAKEFMETYAKTNNKPSEQKNKRLILEGHLLPALGDLNLSAIRAPEFITDLTK